MNRNKKTGNRTRILVTGVLLAFLAYAEPNGDSTRGASEKVDSLLTENEAVDVEKGKVEAPPPVDRKVSDSPGDEPDSEMDDLARGLTAQIKKSSEPAINDGSRVPNQVTGLEFKHDTTGSKVVVSALRKVHFAETKSPGAHQFIYLMQNVATPEKLQRAYDTTEFHSPVAMFTLFQLPNVAIPTSKLIIQLREDQVPTITQSDRGLIVGFGPSKLAEPQVVDSAKKGVLADNIFAKGGSFSGEMIQRLEIKNSDIQDVLRLIARTSGFNVVIGEDVTGKVGTLSLTNIPWDQAFTLVLQSKKLGFVREGNVLRVGTTASLRSEQEEAAGVEAAQQSVEPLKTLLIPVSYAQASTLSPRAKSFLSPRGAVEVDIRTNTIVVKDIESVVNRVQRLFHALDTQPASVFVSAKVVEMRSSFTRNLGLSLTSTTSLGGLNIIGANSFQQAGNFQLNLTAPQFAGLTANFQAGDAENTVKVLANPSVTVVQNQTGTVTQSLQFYVPTTSTVVGGAFVSGSTAITASLTLTVTPIVSSDGSIFMTVQINNSIPTVNGINSQIATRNVNTQVLVENGDTAVVGGVFQDTVTSDRQGLPLLWRLPLLGFLFGNLTRLDARSEIFIFLTAKILNAEESFKRTL